MLLIAIVVGSLHLFTKKKRNLQLNKWYCLPHKTASR